MLTKEELIKMNARELDQEIEKTRVDLLKLRLMLASRQSKETAKLKRLRIYVARIKTIKRMLKMEAPKENPVNTVTK